MKLYLKKAISQVNTSGVETRSESSDIAATEDSYTRRPVGVASGAEASPDDPKVGKRWGASKERQADAAKEARDNTPSADDEEEDAKKSLGEAMDILKSMREDAEATVFSMRPSNLETEFLCEVMGYDYEEVSKGIHWISGRNRDTFNDWVMDRMTKSLASIRSTP